MSSPGVVLRPLTTGDIPSMARVHANAFPDAALTALGQGTLRRYYQWQLTGPHDAVSFGGFIDGRLAGFYIGGRFRGSLSGFLRVNKRYLVLQVLARPWVALNAEVRSKLKAGVYVSRMRQRPEPAAEASRPGGGAFGILVVCVDPTLQRKGLGRTFMAHAELEARRRMDARMELSVHPTNRQAVGFYEALGYERVLYGPEWEGHMRKALA